MSEEKLLPCPHCGGDAKIDMLDIGRYLYAVECENCGCGTGHEETEEKAMAAWNKREPEIVHCRECVHLNDAFDRWCVLSGNDKSYNDYCSRGRRRDQEDE